MKIVGTRYEVDPVVLARIIAAVAVAVVLVIVVVAEPALIAGVIVVRQFSLLRHIELTWSRCAWRFCKLHLVPNQILL